MIAISLLKQLFSKRFVESTLLVIIACGVMIRLGFWQLDRLEQRQALNAELKARLAVPALTVSQITPSTQLDTLRYRAIVARGHFDDSQTVALEGQQWQDQPGIHLLTPLIIDGSDQAVLVDRGWLPAALAEPEQWIRFQTDGVTEITGRIQLSQPRLNAPPLVEPEHRIFQVDLDRLQGQLPYTLLPVFIVQSPASDQTERPFRREPDLRLSNGPHLGYALQWFAFTLILAGGYLKYIRRQQQPVSDNTKSIPRSKPMEA